MPDKIQREVNHCPALDELVFSLHKGQWEMSIHAHGPYTPKFDLFSAFIDMLAKQPKQVKSGLKEVSYHPEEPDSRFSGRTFVYAHRSSCVAYPPRKTG